MGTGSGGGRLGSASVGRGSVRRTVAALIRLRALGSCLWLLGPWLSWGASPDTLRYSTNPHYPPYDWACSDKDFDGATTDLLRLAAPPGIVLVPVVVPWTRALELAKEGKLDLLASLRKTPEREAFLEFTTHRAFPNPIVVFVRRDRAFSLGSWSDLKGRKGGVSRGDTFGGGFDAYWPKELEVEVAASMENNFAKLSQGRIDWFVTSRRVGDAHLEIHPELAPIIALDPPVSDQDIHFAFSRRSPHRKRLQALSRRLQALDHDGTAAALLDRAMRRYQTGQGACGKADP